MQRSFLQLTPAIIVLLLAFWLRVDNLAQYPPGLSNDEGLNTVDAFFLGQGAFYPIFEDFGEPEPLFKPMLALVTRFFGYSVFAYRFHSVLWGVLTVAAAYWAGFRVVSGLSRDQRRVMAVLAAGVLVVSLGHMTLSRAVYRAIPQPFFMLIFVGAIARAVVTYRMKYFLLAGAALGGTIHFYTAGLILPSVVAPIGLWFVLFRWEQRRKWFRGYALIVVLTLLLTSPFWIVLLLDSGRILMRSSDVTSSVVDLGRVLDRVWTYLFVSGDPNPQYNSASVSLIFPFFIPFFVLGLVDAIYHWRRLVSLIVVVFLVLGLAPSVFTTEPIHGLRVIGAYGVFPVVVALGGGFLFSLVYRYSGWVFSFFVLVLVVGSGFISSRLYTDFWVDQPTTFVYERDLTNGEWYFREDRVGFVSWLLGGFGPSLLPVEYVSLMTMRTYLFEQYPNLRVVSEDDFDLPANTRFVVPWRLETGDLLTDTHLFALLHNNTITVLPPITEVSREALYQNIEAAYPIKRDGTIDFLGYAKDLSDDFVLEFEPHNRQTSENIAVFDHGALGISNWRGTDTLIPGEDIDIFLEWQANRQLRHHYTAFLQLQTQDYERIDGDTRSLWRWLHPHTIWKPGETYPEEFMLQVPADLPPGAYRLVAGVDYVWGRLNAQSIYNDPVDDMATIAWVKVPQVESKPLPANANVHNVQLDGKFSLERSIITELDDSRVQVDLFWRNLEQRPDIDATIFVHLTDAEGNNVAQQDSRPWNGQYPTFIWDEDEIVKTTHVIEVDIEQVERIYVGMYTFPSLDRLTATQDGQPTSDNRVFLGEIADLLSN